MHRNWMDKEDELWKELEFFGMEKKRPMLKNTGHVLNNDLE